MFIRQHVYVCVNVYIYIGLPRTHLPMQEMKETWVRSLGQEDALEEETATHPSILAWRIPWMEEPGGHSPWGHKESDPTRRLTHRHT